MRAVALAAFALAAGCTVPLGSTPDAAPCAPSPAFFASDVWLRYLDANQCATSSCHAFDGGHGYLRFRPPGDPPAPSARLADWPAAWRDNYYAATQLVRCERPLESRLLAVPDGKADPHPAEDFSLVSAGDAEALFQEWVSLP